MWMYIIVIPILIIADYYLSLLGHILYKQGYAQKLVLPSYYNPAWQQAIEKRQWFNDSLLINTALITTVILGLTFLFPLLGVPNVVLTFLFGFLIMMYVVINSHHISDILAFYYVKKHRGAFTGHASLDSAFSIAIPGYFYLGFSLIALIINLWSPSAFSIGGFFGIFCAFLIRMHWSRNKKGLNS